ncbi:MAG: hypothetical protein C0446_08515 [Chitinophaga sp.]|nr:hypothetical protein [Chitinophaga sp.]
MNLYLKTCGIYYSGDNTMIETVALLVASVYAVAIFTMAGIDMTREGDEEKDLYKIENKD